MKDVARTFDPAKFTEHAECVICLEAFEPKKARVVALPCDVRHYFHMDCIMMWTQTHNNCPLCKQIFKLKDVRDFNKRLNHHLKKAECEKRKKICLKKATQE